MSQEIQTHYPEETLNQLEHAEKITSISIELQRIYQNASALLSFSSIPEGLPSITEFELLREYIKDSTFGVYLCRVVDHAKDTINSLKLILNDRLSSIQAQSNMDLQEKLEGLLSSANDLIKDHNADIKNFYADNEEFLRVISKTKSEVETQALEIATKAKDIEKNAKH